MNVFYLWPFKDAHPRSTPYYSLAEAQHKAQEMVVKLRQQVDIIQVVNRYAPTVGVEEVVLS